MPKSSTKKQEGHLKFSKDANGKEVLLGENALPVLMEWEKAYLEEAVETLKPKGDVLEIGFGLGFAADSIQKKNPKSHVIIESDQDLLERAKQWSAKHPKTKILEGIWQEKIKNLGQFDCILFDGYIPFSVEELQQNAELGQELSKKAKGAHNMLEKAFTKYKDVKFTDDQIKHFLKEVQKRPNTEEKDVIDFLNGLASKGHITQKQKEHFAKGLKITSTASSEPAKGSTPWINTKFPGYLLLPFIEECVVNHMRPGSRLVSFLNASQKKENQEFKKKITAEKSVKYTEKAIPVKVPEDCPYYHEKQVIVFTIEKL